YTKNSQTFIMALSDIVEMREFSPVKMACHSAECPQEAQETTRNALRRAGGGEGGWCAALTMRAQRFSREGSSGVPTKWAGLCPYHGDTTSQTALALSTFIHSRVGSVLSLDRPGQRS